MNTQPQSRKIGPERLRWLVHLLDEAVALPGGFRIGLDGLIGLLPGVGDSVGAILSAYIVAWGARNGVPTSYLLRMILNLGLDLLGGIVPGFGDLFDLGWKANKRNLLLIEKGMGRASRGRAGERRLIILIVAIVAILLIGTLALSVYVVSALVGWALGMVR